jgi:hypothetical protein
MADFSLDSLQQNQPVAEDDIAQSVATRSLRHRDATEIAGS